MGCHLPSAGEEEQVERIIGHPRDVPGGRADGRGAGLLAALPGCPLLRFCTATTHFSPWPPCNKDPSCQSPLQSGVVTCLSSGQGKWYMPLLELSVSRGLLSSRPPLPPPC